MYRVVGLLLVLWVNRVGAQPRSADRERAAALNRQAEIAFEQGDHRQAAQLLEIAYQAYPEPTVLYNLGRTLERVGDIDAAIAAYRRYLQAAPAAADRAAVEALIDRLDATPRPKPTTSEAGLRCPARMVTPSRRSPSARPA